MTANSTQATESRSLGSTVGRIAHALGREISPGDIAALRRMDPADLACGAFWKVCALYLEDAMPRAAPDTAERKWAVVLSAMARLGGLHHPGRRLGEALAKADFSELRFLRLLRARDAALHDSIRTMAGFLASKAIAVDQADIARLVLSEGRRDEEETRRRLARAFYAHFDRN